MTVVRSRLHVVGLVPKGKCKCLFLCLACRDEIVAEINT